MMIYASADLTGMAIILLLSPMTTRLLTPQQYGVISLLQAVWMMIAIVQYGCMDFSFPIFLARSSRHKRRQQRVLVSATLVASISAIGLCTLFVVAGHFSDWLKQYAEVSHSEFLIFSIGLIPLSIVQWYMVLFRYLHNAAAYAIASLVIRVGTLVLALPLMFFVTQEHRLEMRFAGALVAGLACMIWSIKRFTDKYRSPYSRERFSPPLAWAMFRFGIVMVPGAYIYALSTLFDRLIVQWHFGADQVAILSLSLSLAASVLALKSWFALVWDPYQLQLISTGDKQHYQRRLQHAIYALLLVFMPLAALISVWSERLVNLLYPEYYLPAARLLPLLVLNGAISTLSLVAVATILVAGTPRYHPWIYGTGLLINCAVGITLVPRIGALGAVIGTLAAEIVILIGWIFLGRVWLNNLPLRWGPALLAAAGTSAFIAFYEPGMLLGRFGFVLGEQLAISLILLAVAGVSFWRSELRPLLIP
jgi:O-antigen/teichoic acid export membrane protein